MPVLYLTSAVSGMVTSCWYLLFVNSVAAGVKNFKSGEHSKALKMLDHALDIDPDNVEGLVARGAL